MIYGDLSEYQDNVAILGCWVKLEMMYINSDYGIIKRKVLIKENIN